MTLHYLEQILSLGPMVCTWTMQASVFKQASHLGNLKNLALSVTQRHQQWLCYHLASGNILKSTAESGPCNTYSVSLTRFYL